MLATSGSAGACRLVSMQSRVHVDACPRLSSPTRKQMLLVVDSGSAGTMELLSAQSRHQQDLCCCRLQALWLQKGWCQHGAGLWWMSGQQQIANCDGGLAGPPSLCKCRQSGYRTLSNVSGHDVFMATQPCSMAGHQALATNMMNGPAVARQASFLRWQTDGCQLDKNVCWMDHAAPSCNRLSSWGGCMEPMPWNQGVRLHPPASAADSLSAGAAATAEPLLATCRP